MNKALLNLCGCIIAAVGILFVSSGAAEAVLVAEDNYESASGVFEGGASGSDFGPHTRYAGSSGGIYHETGGRQPSGDGALGLFTSDDNPSSFGRSITDGSAFAANPIAIINLSLRFDVPNDRSGLKGFNLKGGGLGSGFGDNELISVGITQANGSESLFITGTTTQSLNLLSGGILGDIIDLNLQLNTISGAFELTAAVRGETSVSTAGILKSPASTFVPDAIGFIHSDSSASGRNVYYDNLSISAIPEASAVWFGSLAVGFFGLSYIRKWQRRRDATSISAA